MSSTSKDTIAFDNYVINQEITQLNALVKEG